MGRDSTGNVGVQPNVGLEPQHSQLFGFHVAVRNADVGDCGSLVIVAPCLQLLANRRAVAANAGANEPGM